MMNRPDRFDLHTHSNCSDGTDTPARLIHIAAERECGLVALTDHDTIAGVENAIDEGKRLGVSVLPGVEIDTEWSGELHILGLGLDVHNTALENLLAGAAKRRHWRNEEILRQLRRAGADVEAYLVPGAATPTRLHIALALIKAGLAENKSDAFSRWLSPGRPGYVPAVRPQPEEVVGTILAAGGAPVLAHPCHIKDDVHGLIHSLADQGLRGLEAYYPASTAGQTALFVSLAKQLKLLITCGSDSHGENRPQVWPGCAWRNVPELEESRSYFMRLCP